MPPEESLLNEELQLSFWCHSENVQVQLKIKVIRPFFENSMLRLAKYFHEKLLCSISAYCCSQNQNFYRQSILVNKYSSWLSWKSIHSFTWSTNCFSLCHQGNLGNKWSYVCVVMCMCTHLCWQIILESLMQFNNLAFLLLGKSI